MNTIDLRLEHFGPQYVGAAGTVECSTPFTWFVQSGSASLGREDNRAGHLPDEARLPELEKLADDLLARASDARNDRRDHAVQQYHDLAQMIRWLVIRARVGLAIWNDDAPLAKRLRNAEALYDKGDKSAAKDAARSIASELQKLDFGQALESLASTCRTRGELGMLATANARYGRFYAAFVARLERIIGEPLPQMLEIKAWTGQPTQIVYPIPACVSVSESVDFDAVFLPDDQQAALKVEIRSTGAESSSVSVPLPVLGGAYRRAVFTPPSPAFTDGPLSPGRELHGSGAAGAITGSSRSPHRRADPGRSSSSLTCKHCTPALRGRRRPPARANAS